MKKAALLLCVVLLAGLCAAALGDAWTGTVTAADTLLVTSPAEGTLEGFTLLEGQTVAGGETVGRLRAVKVFAPADGTVASVHKEVGEKTDGTVVEIAPTSLYTVTSTVSGIAKTAGNALVHSGETLWMRCTADGSHRAAGVVTQIDGTTFLVEATAGELYVGETVNLYRDSGFSSASLVGKGTVTAHDTLTVSGSGYLSVLRVQPGDKVLRGQWLFSTVSDMNTEITVPAEGVVTGLQAREGDSLKADQTVATLAVGRLLTLTVSADDAARFRVGADLYFTRGDDPHEVFHACRVKRVLVHEEDASLTVELTPEEDASLPLGLSVTVTDVPEG